MVTNTTSKCWETTLLRGFTTWRVASWSSWKQHTIMFDAACQQKAVGSFGSQQPFMSATVNLRCPNPYPSTQASHRQVSMRVIRSILEMLSTAWSCRKYSNEWSANDLKFAGCSTARRIFQKIQRHPGTPQTNMFLHPLSSVASLDHRWLGVATSDSVDWSTNGMKPIVLYWLTISHPPHSDIAKL